jgi:hypothetical protein
LHDKEEVIVRRRLLERERASSEISEKQRVISTFSKIV